MTAAQDIKPFVITRTLNAPRKLVWQAFTEAERLKKWFGPKGFTPDVSKMDLRPGGTYHYRLKGPDGSTMWGKWVFRDRAAATPRHDQFVLRRERRRHPPSDGADLAAGDVVDLHLRRRR